MLPGPAGTSVVLEASIALADLLGHTWTLAPIPSDGAPASDGATESSVRLAIPAEGFLLDLQRTAVAELNVEARRIDTAGATLATDLLPRAGVVWPDGPESPPRLMTAAEVSEEAPAGILGAPAVGSDEVGVVFTGGIPDNVLAAAAAEVSP